MTDYNKALISLLEPFKTELSVASQQRLEAGHSLRILESKSAQDQALIEGLNLPKIDEFIDV